MQACLMLVQMVGNNCIVAMMVYNWLMIVVIVWVCCALIFMIVRTIFWLHQRIADICRVLECYCDGVMIHGGPKKKYTSILFQSSPRDRNSLTNHLDCEWYKTGTLKQDSISEPDFMFGFESWLWLPSFKRFSKFPRVFNFCNLPSIW